jgi:hypothetical protein
MLEIFMWIVAAVVGVVVVVFLLVSLEDWHEGKVIKSIKRQIEAQKARGRAEIEKLRADTVKEIAAMRKTAQDECDKLAVEAAQERNRLFGEAARKRDQLLADAHAQGAMILSDAKGTALKISTPMATASSIAATEQMLQEVLRMGCLNSPLLTVKYLASPSGLLGIEWVVHETPLLPLLVVITRNKRLLTKDFSVQNRRSDMLELGKRYVYEFAVYDGKRLREKTLMFTIHLPLAKDWNKIVDAIMESDKEKTPAKTRKARPGDNIKEKAKAYAAVQDVVTDLKLQREAHLKAKGLTPRDITRDLASFETMLHNELEQTSGSLQPNPGVASLSPTPPLTNPLPI